MNRELNVINGQSEKNSDKEVSTTYFNDGTEKVLLKENAIEQLRKMYSEYSKQRSVSESDYEKFKNLISSGIKLIVLLMVLSPLIVKLINSLLGGYGILTTSLLVVPTSICLIAIPFADYCYHKKEIERLDNLINDLENAIEEEKKKLLSIEKEYQGTISEVDKDRIYTEEETMEEIRKILCLDELEESNKSNKVKKVGKI